MNLTRFIPADEAKAVYPGLNADQMERITWRNVLTQLALKHVSPGENEDGMGRMIPGG